MFLGLMMIVRTYFMAFQFQDEFGQLELDSIMREIKTVDEEHCLSPLEIYIKMSDFIAEEFSGYAPTITQFNRVY